MKLVLLHGRDQQDQDPTELKDKWLFALKEGLKKSNISWFPNDNDVVFPFYGKILKDLTDKVGKSTENVLLKGGEIDTDAELEIWRDLMQEIAANAGLTLEELRVVDEEVVVEKGLRNWPIILKVLRALDKYKYLSEKAMAQITYDVYCYLKYRGIRKKIDEFVKEHVPEEPCIWVAHSLGSVISYNILDQHASKSIDKMITVGSPLGMQTIKRHLETPLRMPKAIVNGWYNGYDKRDAVSLFPLEKPHFEINPAIVNNGNIKNETSERHGIEGYLSDKDVAYEIYKAFKGIVK